MDVASGADRHLDITFGLQVVESSSLISVPFREAFSHPYCCAINSRNTHKCSGNYNMGRL